MAVTALPDVGDNAFEDGFLNKGFSNKVIKRVNRTLEASIDVNAKTPKFEESEENIKLVIPPSKPLKDGNTGDVLVFLGGEWKGFSPPTEDGKYILSISLDTTDDVTGYTFEWIGVTECPEP